ncbi:MAG: hypothetical protein ABW065_03485 [Solirubrobacterales bacterium]
MSKESKIMTRLRIAIALAFAAVWCVALTSAPSAEAARFGIVPGSFDFTIHNQDGTSDLRAGAHPFGVTTKFRLETETDPRRNDPAIRMPAGANLRNGGVALPPGLVGNPYAMPQCTMDEFGKVAFNNHCFDDAQIGIATVEVNFYGGAMEKVSTPIFNLVPPAGQPAAFGFWAITVPIILTPTLRSDGDYGLTVQSINTDETLPVTDVEITIWGVPGSSVHDSERKAQYFGCSTVGAPEPCIYHGTPKAFLTTPVDCADGPLAATLSAESWKGELDFQSILTHDTAGAPSGMTECERVPFTPSVAARPSVQSAETASGLEFALELPDDGIINPTGLTQAEVKKAVVKLPEGMTINPSAGEGLGACTPADFSREALTAPPGTGCPNSSKLGTVRIESPLLTEPAEGSLFIAQTDDPATSKPGEENPFDTLLAMYMVARVPERGIIVRAAGKVVPDPKTGRLVTTFDNLPQLPFSRFTLNFREGARAPLSTPPSCGTYEITSELTPWSAMSPSDVETIKTPFRITSGVGAGPCPSAGAPPFRPGLVAGTLNNSAGSYSPFDLRLSRNDGEQEFTRFSIKLPPGIIGKLAGIPFCPDAAIAAARGRTGAAELTSPSCPAASEVGSTLVGAGVGTVLTYVPGRIYLAGPYNGSALSITAITAAKVGPFDLGTVVIRQALKVNPETAEVSIDSAKSDPIPHIIDGIVVHARDIRAYVDRPEFVLNPTSCTRTSTASTVLGSGLDFSIDADDNPVTVTSPFQAADCASLGFKPKLDLRLFGGTKRGDNPRFQAVLTARKGDANIGRAQVTLPHSEFLDNQHIKTVCTRVQFNSSAVPGENCPRGSIYGYAKAITPVLDEPLQGPVFLRSSSHALPDLVAALHSGKIDINLDGRIDSIQNGRIRNTFEAVPDAPVTKFTLTMRGGRKGLLVNSADLCKARHRAIVSFTGQNGKVSKSGPVLKVKCGKSRRAGRHRHAAG